jgi:hypothetical protein
LSLHITVETVAPPKRNYVRCQWERQTEFVMCCRQLDVIVSYHVHNFLHYKEIESHVEILAFYR